MLQLNIRTCQGKPSEKLLSEEGVKANKRTISATVADELEHPVLGGDWKETKSGFVASGYFHMIGPDFFQHQVCVSQRKLWFD